MNKKFKNFINLCRKNDRDILFMFIFGTLIMGFIAYKNIPQDKKQHIKKKCVIKSDVRRDTSVYSKIKSM